MKNKLAKIRNGIVKKCRVVQMALPANPHFRCRFSVSKKLISNIILLVCFILNSIKKFKFTGVCLSGERSDATRIKTSTRQDPKINFKKLTLFLRLNKSHHYQASLHHQLHLCHQHQLVLQEFQIFDLR